MTFQIFNTLSANINKENSRDQRKSHRIPKVRRFFESSCNQKTSSSTLQSEGSADVRILTRSTVPEAKRDKLIGIYLGNRGIKFKNFLIKILRKGKLKKSYLDMMTDKESLKIYSKAFTSELVDPVNNYQVLEQIGDLSGNKFIVSYMYNKFPQLKCTEGVKVVARLRINYGAKQSFSEIARGLGFWEFISATNDLRQRKMKPLLEDVFEAFLGATESILDTRKRVGVGYAIVYDILSNIFDNIEISLKYEHLYDAKTRLKELFDMHENILGPLMYQETKKDLVTFSTVYRIENGMVPSSDTRGGRGVPGGTTKKRILGGKRIKIGEGSAALKTDAQQQAASSALKNLKEQGWYKLVPEIYNKFNSGGTTINNEKITNEKFKIKWNEGINSFYATKEKSKYQNKYQSTPLAYYCRNRISRGVKYSLGYGADPNIPDTEGMYPLDLLFIGPVNEKKVLKIFKYLLKNNKQLKMNFPVYNMYYKNYVQKEFIQNSKIDLIK